MKREELLAKYEAGARNFGGADLRDADLRAADLSGAYLRDADLSGADLSDADLSDADLEGADLEGADLSGADLEGADLSGADLSGADLSGADLRAADLRAADLSDADLRSADLSGANLRSADLEDAYLLNARGLYSAFAPHMSSRRDSLHAHLTLTDGAITLVFVAGCFNGSANKLRAACEKKHGANSQYHAAIAFIEACFAADMAAGRWDYLKKWEAKS